MIEEFLIISARGDTLLTKNYAGVAVGRARVCVRARCGRVTGTHAAPGSPGCNLWAGLLAAGGARGGRALARGARRPACVRLPLCPSSARAWRCPRARRHGSATRQARLQTLTPHCALRAGESLDGRHLPQPRQ